MKLPGRLSALVERVCGTVWVRAADRGLEAGMVDAAAALTYYAVLSLIPAIAIAVAVLGLVGSHPATTEDLLGIVSEGGSPETANAVRGAIESAMKSDTRAGVALGVGIIGTIWVAGIYTAAFGRAGRALRGLGRRGQLRRRPLEVAATLAGLLLLAFMLLLILLAGELAKAVGEATGIGVLEDNVWFLLKWPVLIAIFAALVFGLYALAYGERNFLRHPTRGAVVAILLWIATSAGFAAYLGTFASYDETYGALGGAISFLVWLWLSNGVLLYGIALDQELEADRTA